MKIKLFTFLSHTLFHILIFRLTESTSFSTMKLSNLRVDTSPSDALPLLNNVLLSDATWPRVATNSSNALEEQPNPNEPENSHRIIRRTFAFDEWDEEHAQENRIPSTMEDLMTNNNANETNTPFDEIEESELDLQYTIRRSFGFDEWDEERSTDNVTPSGRFAPIQTNRATEDMEESPTKLPSFSRYGTNTTKFDIDESNAQHAMVVTPSPPPKLQRPVPLYLQQSSDGIPNDPHCLENMIRASFVPSIPRNASTFSIPTGNRNSFPAADDNEDDQGREDAEKAETHWFDLYGSGTTLFEDDDYVFESPTLSDDDSLFPASTIPRFIVCYQDNE